MSSKTRAKRAQAAPQENPVVEAPQPEEPIVRVKARHGSCNFYASGRIDVTATDVSKHHHVAAWSIAGGNFVALGRALVAGTHILAGNKANGSGVSFNEGVKRIGQLTTKLTGGQYGTPGDDAATLMLKTCRDTIATVLIVREGGIPLPPAVKARVALFTPEQVNWTTQLAIDALMPDEEDDLSTEDTLVAGAGEIPESD